MEGYSTVEEKAAEWGLSSRHVQHLCRKGTVPNGVKHAGIWYIPKDAPSPAKNTKHVPGSFDFKGTKKKIFESAITLFMDEGFSTVSLRDIADRAHVRQSTIYNYFKSKQELLGTIYEFFRHYYLKDRPTLAEVDARMSEADIPALLKGTTYAFHEDYAKQLVDIAIIIFQRCAIDPDARDIARNLMRDEGISYVESILAKAQERGQVDPALDIGAVATFINSIRIFLLFNRIIDRSPESSERYLRDEEMLHKYATSFMTNKSGD